MSILVINCGSTSLKADVICPESGERLTALRCQRLGSANATAELAGQTCDIPLNSPADAVRAAIPLLMAETQQNGGLTAVGHRIVHGGTRFQQPTLIDDQVLEELEDTVALAPLHNPPAIASIRAARDVLSSIDHVAVFDTAFHHTLPDRVSQYALPAHLTDKHQIRRYGFHGTSHKFVSEAAADFLQDDIRNLRIISCHLGGGCSVCAIEYGRSIETSMGMTPLEGLVMATRCGDVDPAILLQLIREEGYSADELDDLLNRKSGLLGMSNLSSDFRDLEEAADDGNLACRNAIDIFCHRVRKYIGAYAAIMGGVDAIVFTAGIGANSSTARHRIAQRLDFLGARLDEAKNRDAKVNSENPVAEVSYQHSRTKILVAHTDEAWEIAKQTAARCIPANNPDARRAIPVAISARHVHLNQETVEALFGPGHELTPLKPLSQPGQFAAEEQVELVGPKRSIKRVRVLGPVRRDNQIEVSRTDEFHLGIDAPIRASGDVENSPGITLIGSDGRSVTLPQGVICAWRHIHMTPDDAKHFGVQDRDVVEVQVGVPGVRSLKFGDVLVRVKPSYKLEMHIDTDEGNAAELARIDIGNLDAGEVNQHVAEATHITKS